MDRVRPGFWRTVTILLGAARQRAAGRGGRQAQLRRKRKAIAAGSAIGMLFLALFAGAIHVVAALDVGFAVHAAERLAAHHGSRVSPDLVALAILGLWMLMLVCQGESPEMDMQRARQPMWEWLFSHPAPPSAIFLAEMIAPIAANPIFTTAPLFFGVLYGMSYGLADGILAAVFAGIPVTIALACLGKAIEINVVLRLPAATRGAVLGVLAWLGVSLGMVLLFAVSSIETAVAVAAPWLAAVPGALVPPARLLVGLAPAGDAALWQGIGLCALGAFALTALALPLARFGARDGLVGTTAKARAAKTARFGRDPLYSKELLWLRRDRRALVQALLVPLSLAAMQTFNLRGLVSVKSGWSAICGLAILFGTYFLLTLGPQSLASEGTALWIAQTWPRGLESLLKAKAKLWSGLATLVVGCALAYAAWSDPKDLVGILAVFAMWWVFGRSLAEKTVTLATVASSSGEQERIPAGRRWAALLGTFAFASGVLTQQWSLAITGVVYSVMTAAAMWQNFRFRLPYLSDPWSEVLPPAPTLMHAMIAIALMVELASVAMGATFGAAGHEGIAAIGVFIYAICAIIVALAVGVFLAGRDVAMRDIFIWREADEVRPPFDAREIGRSALLALAGATLGAALACSALLYLDLLHHWPELARGIDDARRHLAEAPDARNAFYVIAVVLVPLAEEFLFRGLLYRALDREWGGWRAIAGAAAFFAIYHPLTSWLPVGALGAMNAILFKRSGRLVPAIAAHMAYNAVVLLPTFG